MRLMEYLPARIYNGQEHVEDLQNALEQEAEQARQARDDLLLQVRPSTATWGLGRFEQEYGITPDEGKSQEQRLALLRAKRRGTGTSTLEQIHNVAQSFTDSEVAVTEAPREHRFTVAVSSEQQQPPRTGDMIHAIREIQPAHLELRVQQTQQSRGAVHVGAASRIAGTLTVYPYQPGPIESEGAVHIGAAQRWSNILSIGVKEE